MTNNAFWINFAGGLFIGLSICCLLAFLSAELRQVVMSFFNIFHAPLDAIRQKTSGWLVQVRRWLLAQIEDESERKGDGPVYYLIGSVLYSLLTILFVLCDFGMIILTLEAMGMDEAVVVLPLDSSTLTAATLVTTALFWGMILFDLLGVTRLAPWRKNLSPFCRRLFIAIAVIAFTSTIFIGASMALWRGRSLMEMVPEAQASMTEDVTSSLPGLDISSENGMVLGNVDKVAPDADVPAPDTSYDWIILSTMMGIAGLSLASTGFSCVGMVVLIKFLLLLIIGLASTFLLPVSFVTWLISFILNLIVSFVMLVLDFFIAIGTRFMGLFGWQQPAAETAGGVSPEDVPVPHESPSPAYVGNDAPDDDPGFNPFSRR